MVRASRVDCRILLREKKNTPRKTPVPRRTRQFFRRRPSQPHSPLLAEADRKECCSTGAQWLVRGFGDVRSIERARRYRHGCLDRRPACGNAKSMERQAARRPVRRQKYSREESLKQFAWQMKMSGCQKT